MLLVQSGKVRCCAALRTAWDCEQRGRVVGFIDIVVGIVTQQGLMSLYVVWKRSCSDVLYYCTTVALLFKVLRVRLCGSKRSVCCMVWRYRYQHTYDCDSFWLRDECL